MQRQTCGLGSTSVLAHVHLSGAVHEAGPMQKTAGAHTFHPWIASVLLCIHPQHKMAFLREDVLNCVQK